MYLRRQFFELIAQTSDVPQAFEIDHALGPYLFSKNGEAYLDMVSGFSVSNLGHCHTDIVQAIHLQSKSICTAMFTVNIFKPLRWNMPSC